MHPTLSWAVFFWSILQDRCWNTCFLTLSDKNVFLTPNKPQSLSHFINQQASAVLCCAESSASAHHLLKSYVLSSRLRPEHADTQHTQSSINISTEFPWFPKWQRVVDVFILSHWGNCCHGPLTSSNPSHSSSHSAGIQAPEGTGQHRQAARPLHDPDILLPSHQPAVPLCPGVPPLV